MCTRSPKLRGNSRDCCVRKSQVSETLKPAQLEANNHTSAEVNEITEIFPHFGLMWRLLTWMILCITLLIAWTTGIQLLLIKRMVILLYRSRMNIYFVLKVVCTLWSCHCAGVHLDRAAHWHWLSCQLQLFSFALPVQGEVGGAPQWLQPFLNSLLVELHSSSQGGLSDRGAPCLSDDIHVPG